MEYQVENIVKILRGSMSQKKLAELSGISQQAIAHYEKGRFPKPEILEKIAAAAGYKITIKIEKIESNQEDKKEC